MRILDKYREWLNSPEILKYIGDSKRRKFLVNGITGFVVLILLLIAIILFTVLLKVIHNYL